MSVVVFSGPSLPPREAACHADAHCLGPAARGDVVRALRLYPDLEGIVLIDGRFDGVPSVTHREILWALNQGVPVVGAASIGALRAVELAPYGMIGHGTVFSWYAAGRVEHEDEVALVHGPAELDYRPLTDALVDIRATVKKALIRGVLEEAHAKLVLDAAEGILFKRRTFAAVLERVAKLQATDFDTSAFGRWLRTHRVDQKRKDAVRALLMVRHRLAEGSLRVEDRPTFHSTWYWQRLVDEVSASMEMHGSRHGSSIVGAGREGMT